MQSKNVVKEILKDVSPSKADISRIDDVKKKILNKLSFPGVKAVIGGSGAKNTWLRNTNDIDIYVKFNYSKYKDKSSELSEILHKHLKKKFSKVKRLHGSRDYFQIKMDDYTIEMVPILNITKSEQAKNITDFSIFHVKYVNGKVKKKKSLSNEIRLVKVFTKANKVYGAESYIRGFSGYVLELLVIHYGSFLNLIKNVSKWKDATLIGNKKVAGRLNWAKKVSPLILIDPVQPDRNAAAAVSKEQYKKFVKLCKDFLRKPSMLFFEKKDIDIIKLKKKGYLSVVKCAPLSNKRDVAGAKSLKAFNFVVKNLKDFEVVDSVFDFEDFKAVFYIVTKKNKISKTFNQFGPFVKNKKAVKEFKKVYKNVKEEKGRYYVVKERKNRVLKDKLKEILEKEDVVSRVKDLVIF